MSARRQTFSRAAFFACLLTVGLAAQAAPDGVRGEQIYARCLGCHALASDRVGPRHCGLIGRRAATIAGFEYSPAMKQSGLVWNEKSLNRFLTNPMRTVPGTSMTYDGVPVAADRDDLIAYLKRVNTEAVCNPEKHKP